MWEESATGSKIMGGVFIIVKLITGNDFFDKRTFDEIILLGKSFDVMVLLTILLLEPSGICPTTLS